jgi:hypothetical protein
MNFILNRKNKLWDFLFSHNDIAPIVLWRICLGVIFFVETVGGIAVGWVKSVFVKSPDFTFHFIDFTFLKFLTGPFMYVHYCILALLSLAVILGYRFRLASILLAIGWACVYFSQKTSYNNHHYLMMVLSTLLATTPAHRKWSLDVKHGRVKAAESVEAYHQVLLVVLMLIVFIYAAGAKIYPDWLRGVPVGSWFKGGLLSKMQPYLPDFLNIDLITAYFGIIFDLLVIPLLLFKRTRLFAFVIGVFFHLTNSITFQIGTFPYMMISSIVLFLPPMQLRKIFRMHYPEDQGNIHSMSMGIRKVFFVFFIFFISINLVLPLRHLFYKSNVFWSEEGHRLSWRMMLRSKYGNAYFMIEEKDGRKFYHDAKEEMSEKQFRVMSTHPDIIWQYVQYLKKVYGDEVKIFVESDVSLNYRPSEPLIVPDYDMSKAKWHLFKSEEWITKGPDWKDY